jgi:hypothetical protein
MLALFALELARAGVGVTFRWISDSRTIK